MDLTKMINFSLFSCGLVGILLVVVAGLAFLKGRHKVGDRMGIAILALILLGTRLALAVENF